jgi:hypothetical protein
MRGLLLALLATLVGVAMLAVGIAGVAGALDDGSSSSSGSSADVTNFSACEGSDPRLSEFKSFDLAGDGGNATVLVTCQDGALEATLVGTGLSAQKQRTVALWLYRNRKVAALVDSVPQEAGDPNAFLSGALPHGTEDYRKWVVTEEPYSFDQQPAAPSGPVLVQGLLAVS